MLTEAILYEKMAVSVYPLLIKESALPLNIPIREHEYKNACDVYCNYFDKTIILVYTHSLHTHTHTNMYVYIYIYIYI
jgi:hypothetical protein